MKTDPILEEDILQAAKAIYRPELNGTCFFITGATGLIGSQLCKTLVKCNQLYDANITVAAYLRNPEKADKVFAGYQEGLTYVVGNLEADLSYDGPVDYLVHGASVTSSKAFVNKPVETILTAIDGTNRVLRFAAEKQVKKMVYLSSLEVYGTPDGSKGTIAEDDYGYINPLSVRSSYSEGKRMVENLCVAYASQFHVPVCIARLSQTFGAGVEYHDGRVFAEFARCAIEGKDIVLHTDGSTVRTYCYTADAVTALLKLLQDGATGEAYNVTNPDTACSIREMAELVAGLNPEKPISVRIEIPEDLASFGYNPQMVIRLNADKLVSLGWSPATDLTSMFRRTIESMKKEQAV